jgi:hypothetical protein
MRSTKEAQNPVDRYHVRLSRRTISNSSGGTYVRAWLFDVGALLGVTLDDSIFSPPLRTRLTKSRTVRPCHLVAAMISASVAPLARFIMAMTSAFLIARSAFDLLAWPARKAFALGERNWRPGSFFYLPDKMSLTLSTYTVVMCARYEVR